MMSPLEQLAAEIGSAITGRSAGRIFQMGESAIALDFVPHAGSYLFIDYGRRPQAFLIVRKMKHIERGAIHLSMLAIDVKRALSDAVVHSVKAFAGVISIGFLGEADVTLDIDLRTGGAGLVVRYADGEAVIAANPVREGIVVVKEDTLPNDIPAGGSMSGMLDERYRIEQASKSFDRLAADARRSITREVTKARRLLENIEGDVRKHGDPDTWKKFGDLILANLATLSRDGDDLVLTDYFDADAPQIRVPADKNRAPAEAAEDYFRRYTRARNAAVQAARRREGAEQTLHKLEQRTLEIEAAIERRDDEFLSGVGAAKRPGAPSPSTPNEKTAAKRQEITQARRFVSSTGFEILVGKKAVDNDFLTFRVAKSNDLWLHAADYPGSHVIVRNNSKSDVPQNVLHEAARLAAFYSDAREMPKAAVNYTMRKFVQKPKRAAPGMVSLSKFRTLLVEPGVPETVSKT